MKDRIVLGPQSGARNYTVTKTIVLDPQSGVRNYIVTRTE